MNDLFANTGPLTERDVHRRQRARASGQRGYAAKPGTGPEGESCGSCHHLARLGRSKVFHKCRLTEPLWTHSRRTDVLVRSPACGRWEVQHEDR